MNLQIIVMILTNLIQNHLKLNRKLIIQMNLIQIHLTIRIPIIILTKEGLINHNIIYIISNYC